MHLNYPQDSVALVTGAGRGIGKAIATTLAKAGMTVICISRSEQTSNATAATIKADGGKTEALAVDVSDATAVAQASETLLKTYPCIPIVVNNAGITKDNLIVRMQTDDWESVLATNLSSCFYWIKGLLKPMMQRRWGRIVNISSIVGRMGNAAQTNYAASKAGMIGYTKSLARELGGRNITANVVAPGFIETDMTAVLKDEIKAHILQQIPLKRLGTPADIASMVAYLCAEQAGYITGQVFTVDGGWYVM